jgi:transglutaminase-like putative cysteine protease
VSGVAAAAPRSAARERAPTTAQAAALRLVAFAALALFAAAHWMALVDSPPVGRMLLVVLVATATGGAVGALGAPAARKRLPGGVIAAGAVLAGLVGMALALGAAGLPLRLLEPRHWDELYDGLNRGLTVAGTTDWPYSGSDPWVRLTILLGAPLFIGAAALLAFFPVRRAAPLLRFAGLVALLGAYGTAVVDHDPGEPLLRGMVLLVLVGAWLWLPRLRPREALAGAALVLTLGAVSLPVAAALDAQRPWLDYRSWNLFGNAKSVTFDWTHRYGPLNWPRDGTTLLNVKSAHPHYWKAEVLDSFDGLRWVRGRTSDTADAPERPNPASADKHWNYYEWNRKWDEQLRFTVRSLSTDLLVVAGIPYGVQGAGLVASASDGTTEIADPLKQGDSYTVSTYDPDPSVTQMRGAPGGMSSALIQYTSIELPQPGESALNPADAVVLGGPKVFVPLWGGTSFGDPAAPRRALERSVYAQMYRIATRVTAGAPTMYDAVRSIERYLDRSFSYSEKPRNARYPLNAFLFRDKFGYCQQFSGAMALMLRMVGIPARVAAGFAPGSFNRDSGEYRVRDLDAHSWVEVYFNGIGWTTFDPTPPAAPAERQSTDLLSSSPTGGAINGSRSGVAAPDRGAGSASAPTSGSGGGASAWLLLPLLLLLGAGVGTWSVLRRAQRLGGAELAEAQLAELRRALPRLDWELPEGTTLLGLERRLGRAAGPAAARYAAALRAHRYDPRTPEGPSLRQRRELRRDLSAPSGLRGRVLGLIAIPPGGPRPV